MSNSGDRQPRAAILGYPVAQARSPLLHGYWLRELGLPGSYERREVPPGKVAEALHALRDQGYSGGNVTVPHKEEAFACCDRTTERAHALRAVNTFWFENGLICGDNTDGIGFVAHLDETIPAWAQESPDILMIGAGGAARGLILPLLDRHPRSVTVTNRSAERRDALLHDVAKLRPEAVLRPLDWAEKDHAIGNFDLIINTTSLGMAGKAPLDLNLAAAHPGAIVADIVYVPLETPLLAAARARGLRTVDGLGMLLHQAVPGFEIWFGRKPAVTQALRDLIIADLADSKA